MDSIHKMFLSALEVEEYVGRSTRSRDFTAGCRCRPCYSKEKGNCRGAFTQSVIESENNPCDHRTIRERVPGLGGLFPGESNDFVRFFYGKLGPYVCAEEREQAELKDCSLVYSCKEIKYKESLSIGSKIYIGSLYRDLEYTFLNYGWNDVVGLGKLFYALYHSLADRITPYVEITAVYNSSHEFNPETKKRMLGYVFRSRYEECIDPRLDLVRKVFLSGNIGLLDEILKFGGTMFKPRSNLLHELYRAKVVMMQILKDDEQLSHISENYILENILNFEKPARARLYVIMLGLEVCHKVARYAQGHEVDYYKMCLRRVFNTIPEPHIRSSEIRDSLTKLLPPEGEEKIEALTKKYESFFPESTGSVTPRSLKHLSRVQIRHCLKEHGCFIKGMLLLDLPRSVKRYVDLDLFRSKNPTLFWYNAFSDFEEEEEVEKEFQYPCLEFDDNVFFAKDLRLR